MAGLTVAEMLAMPALEAGAPEVLAGRRGLDRDVRWVHSAELADIGPLLREGDFVLSTGIAMPETPAELATYAGSLAASGAAGLAIELGRRWTAVPQALVAACEELALPLIALTEEVRFATVTQSVGERIVDTQLAELREAQRVHETFTELSIAEAGPSEILQAVQRLAGSAVVLESEAHQVLDYRSGPADITPFLADWATRSRAVPLDGRTVWSRENGWLVTRVGKRGRGWGRLIVETPTAPPERLVAVAERAAAALALHRLHDRHRDSVIRRTHHELLLALLTDPTDADVLQRCEVAGVPITNRQLVGLTIRPHIGSASASAAPGSLLDEVLAASVHATHELRVPALICEIDRDIRALLSFARSANTSRAVDELASRLHRRWPVTVAVGRPVTRATESDRTLREAQHVMQSLPSDAHGGGVLRLEDVHLRGLLAMLGEDDRVRMFVDRELGRLREHDAAWGGGLLDAVRALLRHPTSKSAAAASLHVSRPVFYDRLAKAQRVLGVDLDDPDIRVSLHVALIAEDVSA